MGKRGHLCATLAGLLTVGMAVTWPHGVWSASAPGQEQKAPTSAQEAPADPPAEEVYKNIQILKGMPKSRVDRVMDILNEFLGVECTHCHIENEWEREDVEKKQIARQMFQMVATINREYDVVQKKVACWTCHRGSPKPESLPPDWQSPKGRNEGR